MKNNSCNRKNAGYGEENGSECIAHVRLLFLFDDKHVFAVALHEIFLTRKTFQSVLVGLEIVKFLLVYGNFILVGLNLLFKRADLFVIFDAIIQTAVAGNKEQDDEYEDDNPVCINPEEVFM